MDFDIIISGGTVVDGSQAPRFTADVGITGDTICAVGDLSRQEAPTVIDASGKVVSPGFIDMHTHSDFTSVAVPTADSKIRSGVTTEVIGQCGASAFPMRGETYERRVASYMDAGNLELNWHDVDGFFSEAERIGCSINRVPMVGHNSIRGSVMGYNARAATTDEMKMMLREVEIAIEAGVFGFTTGLIYPPGCFAPREEIIELATLMAKAGGLYASHIRDEGDGLENSIEEALEIGERAGIRVHISHLKVSKRRNWDKIDWLKERLFAAIDAGADLTADRYPYAAASTGFDYLMPDWAYEGTTEDKMARLKDPVTRAKLRKEMFEIHPTEEDWAVAQVAAVQNQENRRWEGMRITEIAREMGKDVFDAYCDLIISDNGQTTGVFFRMKEENLREILSWPFVMIGSDGSTKSVSEGATGSKPHPRSYGTATRVLGKYVRETGLLSLEEAVWKLSGFPAKRLGLCDRGRIAENMKADVVVFDEDIVSDTATYEDPHQYSVGIENVIVNGVPTIENGEHRGTLAGKMLRRSG